MDTELTIERNITYATHNGIALGLDIYRPVSDAPLPIMLLVHGGGWCYGNKEGCEWQGRYFANAGYLAAVIDYRLAPTHPFPAACDDAGAAVAWLVAHGAEYGGDPARLGAWGGSAGAHLVGWLAVQPNTPLVCVAAWAGPMDMFRDPVTRPYQGHALAFMNACVHEAEEAYRAASPLFFVHAQMPPLLLIHGEADVVVPVDHAHYMAEAARETGAPITTVLLPGVGHTGGSPDDPAQQPGWQAMMALFEKYLTPRQA